MIPSVNNTGSKTFGLLKYLYDTGKYEDHTDPHLVASFDGMSPDSGRHPNTTLRRGCFSMRESHGAVSFVVLDHWAGCHFMSSAKSQRRVCRYFSPFCE